MTKFFFKFKKPYSWPIFGPLSQFFGQKSFSWKSDCHAPLHKGFWHYAKIQRNLITKFQENIQADVRR